MNEYKNELEKAQSSAKNIQPVLSDAVKIEIVHSIKDGFVQIFNHLIDAAFPRTKAE